MSRKRAWLRRWRFATYIDLHDLWVGLYWKGSRRCDLGNRCPFGGEGGPSHANYPLEITLYVIIFPTWVLRWRYSTWSSDRLYSHVIPNNLGERL